MNCRLKLDPVIMEQQEEINPVEGFRASAAVLLLDI